MSLDGKDLSPAQVHVVWSFLDYWCNIVIYEQVSEEGGRKQTCPAHSGRWDITCLPSAGKTDWGLIAGGWCTVGRRSVHWTLCCKCANLQALWICLGAVATLFPALGMGVHSYTQGVVLSALQCCLQMFCGLGLCSGLTLTQTPSAAAVAYRWCKRPRCIQGTQLVSLQDLGRSTWSPLWPSCYLLFLITRPSWVCVMWIGRKLICDLCKCTTW